MNKKLILIDIDGMFYHSCRDTNIQDSIDIFKEKLDNCIEKTECTHWAGFIGKGYSFRKKLSNDYKLNRINNKPIKYLKTLKEWAISEYNLTICENYESDDAVSYWYNNDVYIEDNLVTNKIICSPDKDILKNIEGKKFNYSYKLEDKSNINSLIKGWWIETTKDESYKNKWVQIIMGDSSDGVSGIKGYGIKKAEQIIEKAIIDNQYLPEVVLSHYISQSKNISDGIYNFQLNYRLLHLLENKDDLVRELNINDLPLNIQEVKTINLINKEF